MDFQSQLIIKNKVYPARCRKLMIALLALLMIVCLASIKNSKEDKTVCLAERYGKDGTVVAAPELAANVVYTQRIPCPQNNTTAVGLCFTAYARENTGVVTVTVRGEQGAFGEKAYDATEIQDNSYIYIPLKQRASAGEMLEITVSSTSPAGQSVTVWTMEFPQMEQFGARLTINGEPQSTQLFVAFRYERGLLRSILLMGGGSLQPAQRSSFSLKTGWNMLCSLCWAWHC